METCKDDPSQCKCPSHPMKRVVEDTHCQRWVLLQAVLDVDWVQDVEDTGGADKGQAPHPGNKGLQ